MPLEQAAQAINLLGDYLGMRDVDALTKECICGALGQEQADAMVLFGGSILAGCDVLASAMNEGIAEKYIIVGGEGHTTPVLRQNVHALYPDFDTEGLAESRVFSGYLKRRYDLKSDYIETESTNCGNNITNLLSLMDAHGLKQGSVILCQDASMQRRMDAGLRKYAPDTHIINYAAYRAHVIVQDGSLCFSDKISGMWSREQYISLLMSEIPRLRDDENGYGPRGKGFIAHVNMPGEVEDAFRLLSTGSLGSIREGDARYAG